MPIDARKRSPAAVTSIGLVLRERAGAAAAESSRPLLTGRGTPTCSVVNAGGSLQGKLCALATSTISSNDVGLTATSLPLGFVVGSPLMDAFSQPLGCNTGAILAPSGRAPSSSASVPPFTRNRSCSYLRSITTSPRHPR